MSYAPKPAGHDDAPVQQVVKVKRNVRLEKICAFIEKVTNPDFDSEICIDTIWRSRLRTALKISNLSVEELTAAFLRVTANRDLNGLANIAYGEMLAQQPGVLRYQFPAPLTDIFWHVSLWGAQKEYFPRRQKLFRDRIISIEAPVGVHFGGGLFRSVVINNTDLSVDSSFLDRPYSHVFINNGTLHASREKKYSYQTDAPNVFINNGELDVPKDYPWLNLLTQNSVYYDVKRERYGRPEHHGYVSSPDSMSIAWRRFRNTDERNVLAFLKEFVAMTQEPKELMQWTKAYGSVSDIVNGLITTSVPDLRGRQQ